MDRLQLGGEFVQRTSRKPFKLSESLQRHLNSYGLAASAAGVGILALAQPADGKIIYTPAHNYVPLNGRLFIDLNHDGRADFYLMRSSGIATSTSVGRFSLTWARARAKRGNGLVGYQTTSGVLSLYPFPAGKQISPGRHFYSSGFMDKRVRTTTGGPWTCFGPWNNVKNRYIGLRFEIKGKTHYGWARLNESCDSGAPKGKGAQTLLTGYAYETIPSKPIITGKTKGPDVITLEPGSLGALAAGAPGLHR